MSTLPAAIACTHSQHHRWYHVWYGLRRRLYLPDDLKRAIELEARRQSLSEAEVIRQALRSSLADQTRRRPCGGLFASGDPVADRVDDLLADGFGQ